jgi:signal peptidase I
MKRNTIWEYTKAIVTAFIFALVIRSTIVQAYKIPSGSMIPTLLVGDHLLANKFVYGERIPFTDEKILVFEKPKRGDIIIFRYPRDPSKDFIKRVIAVEGDVVEERNKQLFVNGKPLVEPYVQYTDNSFLMNRDNFGPYLVPHNKVFVMGDNRDRSYDSRYWGYVDLKDIEGKAFLVYWSWNNMKDIPRLQRIGHLIS